MAIVKVIPAIIVVAIIGVCSLTLFCGNHANKYLEPLIMCIVCVMLICFCWKESGSILVALGSLSNLIVIIANNYKMPVLRWAFTAAGLTQTDLSGNSHIVTDHACFTILADIIPMRLPLGHAVLSIGDVLLLVGIILLYLKCRKLYYQKVVAKS